MNPINIALVDDHKIFSTALENMISSNPLYKVSIIGNHGDDFIEKLNAAKVHPEIVLMDVRMPYKDGIETTQYLTENHPNIKVIALTMEDNEDSIIKMLKAGAKGYLLKDIHPQILFDALETVHQKGVFYTDDLTQNLLKIKTEEKIANELISSLKNTEKEFIKLACSEMTYKEIAEKMCLSPKTIDGYRDSVFSKLDVKSRVGIVLFALKNRLS
ncbi:MULTISPECIES: response regulator transcription factor [Amniculibacterium]|uniref:response regulator transcription factor n=1 Tax=Amniculibacterium TaxID=2715289 RepID=UPI000F5A05FA|nr:MULTISPECIES: response regulator transcription factor [Amniculibacterium]